jgi:hypothetical protein
VDRFLPLSCEDKGIQLKFVIGASGG